MKILPPLLLIFCVFMPIQTKDDNSLPLSRTKRGVVAGLTNVVKRMTLKKFFDFATDIFKKIPLISEILFSKDDENDIKQSLNEILATLQNLQEVLTEISFKLDINYFRDQIAEITKQNQNCFTNLLEYELDQESVLNRDRLLACQSNIEDDVREIIRIVEGDPRSILPKSLFQTLHEHSGQCKGTVLLPIYNYLLGEYFLGCTVLINGAKLAYPNETGYVTECQNGVEAFLLTMEKISSFCANEDCDIHKTKIKDVLKDSNNNMTTFLEKASPEMFWFEFVLTKSNENCEVVKDGVDAIPNNLVANGIQIFYSPITHKGMGQFSNITSDHNNTCFELRDYSLNAEFVYDGSIMQCTWECERIQSGLTTQNTNVKVSSCKKIFQCCSKSLVSFASQKCSFTVSSAFKPSFDWMIGCLLHLLYLCFKHS